MHEVYGRGFSGTSRTFEQNQNVNHRLPEAFPMPAVSLATSFFGEHPIRMRTGLFKTSSGRRISGSEGSYVKIGKRSEWRAFLKEKWLDTYPRYPVDTLVIRQVFSG